MRDELKNKLIGNLLILGTIVIYSFNTNYMKTVVPTWIGPFGLVFFRCLASFIGFFIIILFLPRKELVISSKKEKIFLLIGGVLGMGANMLFYIIGLEKSGPIDAFIIRTSQPIIVLILSIIFFNAHLYWNKVLGIILGIGGTVYITAFQTKTGTSDGIPYLGDLYLLISSIFYSTYLVLIKRYTMKINPFVILTWLAFSGTILTMPFGLKELIEAPLWSKPLDIAIMGEILFILFCSTMIVNILIVKALKYVSSFTASIYIFLLPITGSLITIWMGLQSLSLNKIIAFILILSGFVFININKRSKRTSPHYPLYDH